MHVLTGALLLRRTYRFVEKHPAAKSYYTLSASVVKFSFPPPGSLMGVRSSTRAILKLTNCTFTYPNAPKPSLFNASCAVTLSSRVGVVGPNGWVLSRHCFFVPG